MKNSIKEFQKWLNKPKNKSYCSLPAQYILDKYLKVTT